MLGFARVGSVVLITLLLSGLTFLHPVYAAGSEVVVKIAPKADLLDAGASAEVKVTVSCPEGRGVLEAFLYVTQDGFTSQFMGIPVVCTGKKESYTARVSSFEDSPFHVGEATATGYVLLAEGDLSGGDFRSIKIK